MTGKSLHSKRLKIGITQKDLAKSLCVTVGCVSLWESEKRSIPKSIEKLFCILYDFPFNEKDIYNDPNQPNLF